MLTSEFSLTKLFFTIITLFFITLENANGSFHQINDTKNNDNFYSVIQEFRNFVLKITSQKAFKVDSKMKTNSP
jgi:hypothetical protein